MRDRSAFDRVVAAHRYLVLGTADRAGDPWVSPVFFAAVDPDRVCWVSSSDSRHSRNLTQRPMVALTWFDSGVEVGRAEAAYATGTAAPAVPADVDEALTALNARLPSAQHLTSADLAPDGPLVVYLADLQHRRVLVRGGDPEVGNTVDMTVEV